MMVIEVTRKGGKGLCHCFAKPYLEEYLSTGVSDKAEKTDLAFLTEYRK